MHCPNCGQTNEENSKFCGSCGQPLVTNAPPTSVNGADIPTSFSPIQPVPPITKIQKPGFGTLTLWVIATMFGAGVGGILVSLLTVLYFMLAYQNMGAHQG